MQTNSITNKKIYDDFESMLNNKKRNSFIWMLKIILISFFVLASGLILFFAPLTLFSKKLFLNQNIQWFLVFSNPTLERINYLALFRVFLLMGIFFYTFIKNFSNTIEQKEAGKKYLGWFVTYLVFSLTALVLLFTFFRQNTLDYYFLALISIPLLILDLAYSIYKYKLKRKTDPLIHKNKNLVIISNVARGILVFSFLIILSIWVFSIKGNKNDFLNNNIMHNFFLNMFSQRDVKNLIYLILFLIFLAIILFGIKIEKIILAITKQNKNNNFKEKIILYLFLGFVVFLWFIRTFFYKNANDIIVANKEPQTYLYLIGLGIIVFLFIWYLLINFIKKFKVRGLLVNNIILGFMLGLIWIIVLINVLVFKNKLETNLSILFGGFFSLVILLIHRLKIANESYYVAMFLEIIIILMLATLLISGLNSILLANNNQSFYNVSSKLSLEQIFVITTAVLIIAFNLALMINLFVVLMKLTKKSNNIYIERN
ncbi:MSC_0624 family F1-like ATPase-associated membrane protein [Metamycoplasma alkalescens]|uniref:Uncharacterized protein n=1 Tax=Metamycoplasma alkalescens TaxID=45363 RepID=A0A318U5J1_9BACT|nr:hypothetical protein [Metamycoplasma alkalescens]PYF43605.1 hypothetical protein BCF88_10329 [Metamycoplasma alkalescens]